MNNDNHVMHQTVQHETQDHIMTLSDDGYVRINVKDFLKTSLSHLISINEETKISGQYTQIFGYTEWVSITRPVISVGWDWQLSHNDRFVQIVRIGQARSNMMFIDEMRSDIGQDNTEALINQTIDLMAWELIVKEHIIKSVGRDDMVLSYS